MDKYTIGIALFFSTILISIGLMGRAKIKLNREKLVVVSQLNSISIKYLFVVILGIVLLSSIGTQFKWINPIISFLAIILVLAAYIVLSFVLTLKKLKENNFPESYINTYKLCAVIKIVGVALLFSFLIT